MIFQRNPYAVGSNPTRPAPYHGAKIGPGPLNYELQISIENVKRRNDPYQLFLDSFKNKETRRRYKNYLNAFLKLVPNKFYEEILDEVQASQQTDNLVNRFVILARKNPSLVQNIIAAFIKEDKKLVESKQLNPNTIPNHIKPIKALLDANAIPIHWKSLYKLYPRPQNTEDRAYTREELQKMIEASPDLTDKLVIQMYSSGGFRLEAWDYFTWKDVVFFRNKDGSYKGAALLVYRGDPESYWTFITPEACKTLENYMNVWKSQVGRYPLPDEPLIKAVKFAVVRRLNAKGVRRRVEKIVKKIGLRQQLPLGKKRHEVPLDHGFRKYFNTMMRRAKVNFLDKEDMMGHSVGLEKHYERYQEEDFERFPEYQKAIPFLTISDEERQKIVIKSQQEELGEKEQLKLELDTVKDEYLRMKDIFDMLHNPLMKEGFKQFLTERMNLINNVASYSKAVSDLGEETIEHLEKKVPTSSQARHLGMGY